MKLLVSLLSVAAVAGVQWNSLGGYTFDHFVKEYAKDYRHGSPEYEKRKTLFQDNMKLVTEHNEPGRQYKLGINFFSDMTEEEFSGFKYRQPHDEIKHIIPSEAEEMRWLQQPKHHQMEDKLKKMRMKSLSPEQNSNDNSVHEDTWEASVDWSEKYNSDPPFQNGGSCWAHASMAALEAHAMVAAGDSTPPRISVQEILSCTPNHKKCGGSGACGGSIVELAYDYVKTHGVSLQSDYPFEDDNTCTPSQLILNGDMPDTCAGGASAKPGKRIKMTGYTNLETNKYGPLMEALQTGPVPVAISTEGFRHYENGILPCNNKDALIGHAVLLVGYGETEQGEKFWKIRNSWGTSWGERGHVRLMRRDKEEGHCGTDDKPWMGTGCVDGAATVPVCGACGILFDAVKLEGVSVVSGYEEDEGDTVV